MPTVNTDIYTILNSAVAEAQGTAVTPAITAGNFVDFGRTTMATADADVIFGKLIDRIGKTAVMNRVYNSKWRGVLSTELEFGAILQRLRVAPVDAQAGEQFNISDALQAADLDPYVIQLPDVAQTLFKDFKAYQFGVTVTREQLKSAFVSEAALAAFIEGVYTAIANSVEIYIERAIRLAVNTYICEKYTLSQTATTRRHAVNLVAAYNADTGKTITAATALKNPDFLRWATQYIGEIKTQMSEMSTVFNTGDIPTFEDSPMFIAHTTFIRGVNTYVVADTYNADKLTALTPDIEVSGWQAVGSPLINQTYTGSDGTTKTVENLAVIGVLYSPRGLGATVFDHSADSIYNPRRRYYNIWEHITCGYFADLAECGCVFYLAD